MPAAAGFPRVCSGVIPCHSNLQLHNTGVSPVSSALDEESLSSNAMERTSDASIPLPAGSSSEGSYGDVHWSSRRSEHAEYHASHRHGRGHQGYQARPSSRPRDDSRGYGPTKYSSGELGRSGQPRRSSRQNGYSSERSQTRPPPTRSSSRSGRPDSYGEQLIMIDCQILHSPA